MAIAALLPLLAEFGPLLAKSGGAAAGASGGAAAAGSASTFGAALKQGSTFGDIMAGKTTSKAVAEQAANAGREAAQAEQESQVRAQTIEGVKNLGKAATGSFAALTGLAASAKVLVGLQENQIMSLRGVNAGLAGSSAMLEAGRFQRKRERAAGVESEGKQLLASVNRLEGTVQPYMVTFERLLTATLAEITDGANLAIKILEVMAKSSTGIAGLLALFEQDKKPIASQDTMGKLLQDIASGGLETARRHRIETLKEKRANGQAQAARDGGDR